MEAIISIKNKMKQMSNKLMKKVKRSAVKSGEGLFYNGNQSHISASSWTTTKMANEQKGTSL